LGLSASSSELVNADAIDAAVCSNLIECASLMDPVLEEYKAALVAEGAKGILDIRSTKLMVSE